jgi:Tn3 transposase DDE domain
LAKIPANLCIFPKIQGELRFKTEYEQDLWAECSRLIAICIILYNAAILSRLLEQQETIGDGQGRRCDQKNIARRLAAHQSSGPLRVSETAGPTQSGHDYPRANPTLR